MQHIERGLYMGLGYIHDLEFQGSPVEGVAQHFEQGFLDCVDLG